MLDIAVLGLLDIEPMHGYQLMRTIAERTGGRWSPSPGAIYPTLSQLEDEGLITIERALEQTGLPAELAEELATAHGVRVEPVAVDLATAEGREHLVARAAELGHVHTLVNNAGFATVGEFADVDPARMADEITLNCVTLTLLTRALLPAMIDRRAGAVINIASTAAYQPIPTMAVYRYVPSSDELQAAMLDCVGEA